MIDEGVKTDVHPAGVQTFMYFWVKAFGTDEWIVRLPFVLMSLLAVWFTFRVGTYWINPTVGLLAAAAQAVLQYPVGYSYARPYASGIFLCIWMVWHWSHLVEVRESPSQAQPKLAFRHLLGYALATALCAYNHHFSLLFAGLVGLTGLFLVKKHNWKPYVLAGLAAAMLYLPHVPIFIAQLQMGGTGWLSPPSSDFLLNFLKFVGHHSYLMTGYMVGAVLVGFVFRAKDFGQRHRWRLIALTWFLLPFLIGFTYSQFFGSVLQPSVLIFGFPFLLIFLFSATQHLKPIFQWLLVGGMLLVGVYSLTVERRHYEMLGTGGLKGIAEKIVEWDKKLGKDSVTTLVNVNNRYYVDYYFEQLGRPVECVEYSLDGPQDYERIRELLAYQETDYLSFAWSNKPTAPPFFSIVRESYPYLKDRVFWFNSEYYLFSKKPEDAAIQCDFSAHSDPISSPDTVLLDLPALAISPENTYPEGISLSLQASQFPPKALHLFGTADIYLPALTEAFPLLVVSMEAGDKVLYWHSVDSRAFVSTAEEWHRVHFAVRRPAINWQEMPSPETPVEVKAYLWNKSQQAFFQCGLTLCLESGNEIEFGLFEKL